MALCLVVLAGCSARQTGGTTESPELRLTVSQKLGEIPFEVTINGHLSGGRDDDPRYYCLDVEWDLASKRISESVDCDPIEDGNARIRRAFSIQMLVDRDGDFDVELVLRQGREVRARAKQKFIARRSSMGASRTLVPVPN